DRHDDQQADQSEDQTAPAAFALAPPPCLQVDRGGQHIGIGPGGIVHLARMGEQIQITQKSTPFEMLSGSSSWDRVATRYFPVTRPGNHLFPDLAGELSPLPDQRERLGFPDRPSGEQHEYTLDAQAE